MNRQILFITLRKRIVFRFRQLSARYVRQSAGYSPATQVCPSGNRTPFGDSPFRAPAAPAAFSGGATLDSRASIYACSLGKIIPTFRQMSRGTLPLQLLHARKAFPGHAGAVFTDAPSAFDAKLHGRAFCPCGAAQRLSLSMNSSAMTESSANRSAVTTR